VGDCLDNTAVESLWARAQIELLNTRKWVTTIEMAASIADYIDGFHTSSAAATSVIIAPQNSKHSGHPPLFPPPSIGLDLPEIVNETARLLTQETARSRVIGAAGHPRRYTN
jgi:hypothetical protein